MGYICHHTIVVTSWDEKRLQEAHEQAIKLFSRPRIDEFGKDGSLVSPIIKGVVNGYASFFVAPDGSKEGWATSDNGNEAREQFVTYLRNQAYEDGSTSLNYAEVQFGDEAGDTCILNSSDDDYNKFREEHKDEEE